MHIHSKLFHTNNISAYLNHTAKSLSKSTNNCSSKLGTVPPSALYHPLPSILTPADLLNVVLDPLVAGVHHVTGQLEVPMDDQRLVRFVRVDSDSAHVVGGVLSLTLLPAQLHIGLELTRVRRLGADGQVMVKTEVTSEGNGVKKIEQSSVRNVRWKDENAERNFNDFSVTFSTFAQ